jgi:hypothetical protein
MSTDHSIHEMQQAGRRETYHDGALGRRRRSAVHRGAGHRAAPALAGLLFAGGFLFMARQSRLVRHYVLAVASALLGVLMLWPTVAGAYGNLRVWALLMALLSLSVGVAVLRRFLRDHPVVQDRMPDAN